MTDVPPSSSLTDEEIEAFLATRPLRDRQDASTEDDNTDLMELLMNNNWSLPNHLTSIRDGTDQQQNYDHQRNQQGTTTYSNQNTPSAFAAQFMPGTPEQGILLRALAEQQQEGRNTQSGTERNDELLSIRISPRIATRSTNPNVAQLSHQTYQDRDPTGTLSASTSFSSSQDDGASRTLSDGTPGTAGGKSEIPPSLSAELAGLGLDVDNFYKSTMMQPNRSNDEYEEDVFMDTADSSMQRTSSSSSASTTKRTTGIGDQSLFSQNTTTSSGLDDSVYSTNEVDNSRWIHGRDTPPVSPSPPGSRDSLSIADRYAAIGKSRDVQMTTTTSDMGPSYGFLQPSTKQYPGSRLSIGGMEYPQTWPRTFSTGSGAAGTMSSSTDSSTQNTPSLSSSTGFIGPERMRNNARSPIQHSRSDNPIYSAGRSPQLRLARSPSTSSSISQQKEGTAASTIAAASAAIGSSSSRRNRPSSRLLTMPEAANLSVESLRSDYTPSLTSRMRSGSSIGTGGESSGRGKERNKRWSTSFISPTSSFDQPINRRRAGRSGESDQYEEVSNALETLRTFLRQRDGNNAKQTIIPSRRSSTSQFSNLTAMSNEALQSAQQGLGTSSPIQKVLRHPPAGPLPPRGSLYDRNEAAALHAHELASRSSSHSLSPATSINLSPPANDPRSHIRTNTNSPMSSNFQRQQHRHNRSTSSASIDRIAALEDLADRVRRMREEDRSLQVSMQENDHFGHRQ
ncbi:uncharacterized protein FA14DRAFT_158648 [Meira miltonrushii]|uniref:Uncharacterized protein n=1 Tax=Meira miltonrushii TaxID=1280837 RepID=A0A316V2P9_9BASI|nr:uncharacterized protein FA14DRAFT_158648 [Meira miltonrushii]PWN31837.1 hypothetical protein FA14DRAFT_158648 [Meira miltonrushii]